MLPFFLCSCEMLINYFGLKYLYVFSYPGIVILLQNS